MQTLPSFPTPQWKPGQQAGLQRPCAHSSRCAVGGLLMGRTRHQGSTHLQRPGTGPPTSALTRIAVRECQHTQHSDSAPEARGMDSACSRGVAHVWPFQVHANLGCRLQQLLMQRRSHYHQPNSRPPSLHAPSCALGSLQPLPAMRRARHTSRSLYRGGRWASARAEQRARNAWGLSEIHVSLVGPASGMLRYCSWNLCCLVV
mmetsp:Transcript_21121/g.53677  ORF Transcript_21121/g.53677 Transcript_21121/m.53677 type:complete len:203 (+) Transcript_21121:387-995(+)